MEEIPGGRKNLTQSNKNIPNAKFREGKHQSINSNWSRPPMAGGGLLFKKETSPTIDKNLGNFIFFHASVQQNAAWQTREEPPSSRFLKVLAETIKKSAKEENRVDIMNLSFALVKEVNKVPYFEETDDDRNKPILVKLMCEAEVNLTENFNLGIKGANTKKVYNL